MIYLIYNRDTLSFLSQYKKPVARLFSPTTGFKFILTQVARRWHTYVIFCKKAYLVCTQLFSRWRENDEIEKLTTK